MVESVVRGGLHRCERFELGNHLRDFLIAALPDDIERPESSGLRISSSDLTT